MSNPIWAVNDDELLEKEIEDLLNNLCTDEEAQVYLDSMPDMSDEEIEYLLSLI